MNLRIFLCWLFVVALFQAVYGREDNVASERFESNRVDGYCGIYCGFTALRELGIITEFSELLSSKYISSRRGSSANDLVKLVEDHGLSASVFQGLTCSALYFEQHYAILHTRNPSENTFEHWILFGGVRNSGELLIFDPATDDSWQEISEAELLSMWDGVSIFVDHKPVRRSSVIFNSLHQWLFVVLWIFILLRIASSFLRERRTAFSVFFLLAVALSLSSYQHLISRKGFLNNQDAIQNVISSNLDLFLPRIGYHDVKERVFNDGAVVFDARSLKQHALGAIPGSVCVSPTSSDKELVSLLQEIELDKTVIIYCNSSQCGSDLELASRLSRLGYVDLQIYGEGYEDWVLHSDGIGVTGADAKGAVQ